MLLPNNANNEKKRDNENEKKRFKPLIHTLIKFCFKIIIKKIIKEKQGQSM
jgi:hypothetical protein